MESKRQQKSLKEYLYCIAENEFKIRVQNCHHNIDKSK